MSGANLLQVELKFCRFRIFIDVFFATVNRRGVGFRFSIANVYETQKIQKKCTPDYKWGSYIL